MSKRGTIITVASGHSLRFKGDNGERYAHDLADELRGTVSRNGSKLVFTHPTKLLIRRCDDGDQCERIVNLAAFRSHHE